LCVKEREKRYRVGGRMRGWRREEDRERKCVYVREREKVSRE